MIRSISKSLSFVLLIFSYFFSSFIYFFSRKKIRLPVFGNISKRGNMSQIDLIELSIKNLKAKKNRTVITIGGMTIGIAVIVFLVSLGYGLQELVVKRVARLEEMSQMDVTAPTGGNLKINDEVLNRFSQIPNVEMSLPLISVVGRVSYQNSISDMAVYGITSDYLKQSAIKPIYGKIFDNNETVSVVERKESDESMNEIVGGEGEGEGEEIIQEIEFNISLNNWIRVRETADSNSKIIGYTKRSGEKERGVEVLGKKYLDFDGKQSNKWIKAKMLLWTMEKCSVQDGDCENGKYKVARDTDGGQTSKIGYFAQISGVNVLGQVEKKEQEAKIELVSENISGEAVVNKVFLDVLGIKENEAVGKKFEVTFVIVGNLLNENEANLESSKVEYKIVGVTVDDKSPIFYVPFLDLRGLGINNYSQIKVVVDNPVSLPNARKQIEAMGYMTRSVADTVAQINSLFATLRTMLALLGFMALSVAALGMFNTLTVSLMERTREVGLMKAMGMKSSEIRDLFMAESLIMGLCGGVCGLIVGFLMGKILSLSFSVVSISKGFGIIDVSYIPFMFLLVILILALIIGLITGIYPSRRATKISALNALRYE